MPDRLTPISKTVSHHINFLGILKVLTSQKNKTTSQNLGGIHTIKISSKGLLSFTISRAVQKIIMDLGTKPSKQRKKKTNYGLPSPLSVFKANKVGLTLASLAERVLEPLSSTCNHKQTIMEHCKAKDRCRRRHYRLHH